VIEYLIKCDQSSVGSALPEIDLEPLLTAARPKIIVLVYKRDRK